MNAHINKSAMDTCGNNLYNIKFRGGTCQQVGTSEEEVDNTFARQWGISYTFSLIDAVDEQEEYVLPWDAFEELANSLGFRVVLDGPFPDIFKEYSGSSTYFRETFSKNGWNTQLTS